LHCATCGARTNNAFLADIHDCQPREATPTESMIAHPTVCADDKTTTTELVEARRANTRHACDKYAHDLCTPLPVPRQCAVDGCQQMTVSVVCQDCEDCIASGDFDHKPVPWSTVLWFLAASVGAITAIVFLAGSVSK
jgi:hypothetical protein